MRTTWAKTKAVAKEHMRTTKEKTKYTDSLEPLALQAGGGEPAAGTLRVPDAAPTEPGVRGKTKVNF